MTETVSVRGMSRAKPQQRQLLPPVTTVQVRGDSLVEIVGDILVTIDAANPLNCDTIAAKLLEGLESCGVEVKYEG